MRSTTKAPTPLFITLLLMTVMTFSSSCQSDPSPKDTHLEQPSAGGTALVMTTDYTTGSFSLIDLETLAIRPNLGSVHSDAVATVQGDLLLIINRLGQDNIQIIDPLDSFRTVGSHSVGNGTNPQDAMLLPDSDVLLVARLQHRALLLIDVVSGEHMDEIDLHMVADDDGLPEPNALLQLDDGKVVVTCQRIDQLAGYVPTDSSVILIVDHETGNIERQNQLSFTNPSTGIQVDPSNSDLIVGGTGAYFELDGGVERLDPNTLESKAVLVTEVELKGDLLGLALGENGWAYALVSDSNFNSKLVRFSIDVQSPAEQDVLTVSDAYPKLAAIAVDPQGRIWVADRNELEPGIRIFSADGTEEITTTALDTGLPPNQVVFLD